MAVNEEIILKTGVETGESIASVKSLKQELRSLVDQMGRIQDQSSEAFQTAAARAGQLREQIRGVNDAIENSDPEKKFAPFARTVAGLAGGFAAAQGAMALFGSESKQLEQALLKVQGAMAFSQGLNSVLEFKNDFKDLGKIIIEKVVTAFTTLRGALIATGLGALAIAVGTLVTNWDKLSDAITNTFPSLKVVGDFFNNFRQIASGTLASITEGFKVVGEVIGKIFSGDFSDAIKSASEFGERTAKAYNESYAETDRKMGIENGLKKRKQDLDLLEAQGKDVRKKRIELMNDELSLLKKGSDEYIDKQKEIYKLQYDLKKEAAENQKKIDDEYRNNKLKEAEDDYKFYSELSKTEADKKLQDSKDAFDVELSSIQNKAETETSIYYKENKQRLKDKQETADADKKIDEDAAIAKKAIYSSIGSALGSLASIVGEQTEAGKALAIAQTTINTYAGAMEAFTGMLKIDPTGITGGIVAASVIATGIANIAKIASVKVPKAGDNPSGGNPSGGNPSGNILQAPNISRRLPPEDTTTGGKTTSGETKKDDKPLRVYVVANDITSVQNDIKTIIDRSSIG